MLTHTGLFSLTAVALLALTLAPSAPTTAVPPEPLKNAEVTETHLSGISVPSAPSVVQSPGTTTRVSIATDGGQGNEHSRYPSISADGRYVAFSSEASNLVVGDTNDRTDVFVHDRQTGQTTRVSLASDGAQGNDRSSSPSISADGCYVAFQSHASNLISGDTNDRTDVFVHGRQTGQTTRASVASDGTEGNGHSQHPSISNDGRHVAFASWATNFATDDTNSRRDIFVHDRGTGQTSLISVATSGTQGNNNSEYPTISADGRYVAFQSHASNLVSGDTNDRTDVFVHDRQTGQTTRASVASDGTEGNSYCRYPSISADGRYVAFDSDASNLISNDTNGTYDVFIHDQQTGQTTCVSVASDGSQGSDYSAFPCISADGCHIIFQSDANNLVSGDTNGVSDVFAHDRQTGQTTRVSITSSGSQANNGSGQASVSGDGSSVAFHSGAGNLVNGDTNNAADVFVHDRRPGPTYSVSGHIRDSSGNPIPGVTVSAGAAGSATTDASGAYTIPGLVTGTYVLTANKNGYEFSPVARVVRVPPDATDQDFTTTPVYGSLTGQVTDRDSGVAIANARISAGGKVGRTDASGNYTLTEILPGLHNLYVSADGYKEYKGEIVIEGDVSTVKDVALEPVSTSGYYLPYPGGKTYECTQGNGGQRSHKDTWYYAFDFGMPNSHEVVASQGGHVVDLEESYTDACHENTKKCKNSANYVRIRHRDGTDTLYWHLDYNGVLVDRNDFVQRGQLIAKSDHTGYSDGPHLDFTRHEWGGWNSIPISFADVPGNGIPETGEWYTSGNYSTPQVLGISETAADTDPPRGNVQFRLTGQPTHTLVLSAFDYITNVTDMRLATIESDLQAASWLSFTKRTEWTAPAVFAQYRDANDNVSAIVSDTIDAVGYESIQAAFAVSPTVCVGRGLSLTNHTTPFCEQCSWLWSFGDGTTSEQAEPEFDYVAVSSFAGYATPGMHTVTLTVTNAISASSVSHQVQALPSPSADFTMVRSRATITVEAEAADAAGWAWDFGDGVTATGRIATHTYTDTALLNRYPVQLEVEGTNGCTSWGYQYVPPYSLYLPLVIRNQ